MATKKINATKKRFLAAIKKADREVALTNATGFVSNTKVHVSKKVYNRKKVNNNEILSEI